MAVSIKSLGIDRLNVDERLALVEELWDSIAASGSSVPLTLAQQEELDRRLADHAASPSEVVTWADTKSALDKQKQ